MQKESGITLRSWSIEDAPALAEAINNKNVLDNLRDGIPLPYNEKDAEEFIVAMLNADKNTSYPFAVTCDDKVIGSIGAFRKDNIHHLTAEIGYYIAEPYWGKGLMTEAVRQMCSYMFGTPTLFGYLLNLSPIILLPAAYWRNRGFSLREFCVVTLLKTVGCWT